MPQFWLLTKRRQSRIFPQMSVPDILKKCWMESNGLRDAGHFREARVLLFSTGNRLRLRLRLMEEDGIFYFFKHTADAHKMVLANTPQSHPDLPFSTQIVTQRLWEKAGRRCASPAGNKEKSFVPASLSFGIIASSCRTKPGGRPAHQGFRADRPRRLTSSSSVPTTSWNSTTTRRHTPAL